MKKTLSTHHTRDGFTLIELILYIALVAICLSGTIVFGWDIVFAGAKSNVQREVHSNIRLASRRIAYEIRNASAIRSVSSNALCLASATSARNPTRIYLSNSQLRIAWGGGSTDCTGMTNDQALTSNAVTVSSVTFTNHSSGSDTFNIQFSLTVSKTGARPEWQQSQTYQSSAEIRSN